MKVKYITAFDPIIKKKVAHIVKNGVAYSLVTGNQFNYKPKKRKRKKK